MSTKLKGLPPRVLLRINDNKSGSYPTLAKNSSDNRKGNYKVFFNDENTISFVNSPTSDFSVKDGPIFDLKRRTGFYSNTGSLVSYWKFDRQDASGASNRFFVDHASGTHTLTASAAVDLLTKDIPYNTGTNGSVFSNVGANYFTTLDSADLSFGNGTTDSPFSIVCWTKLPSLSATNRIMVAKSGSSGREYSLGLDLSLGGLVFRVWDQSSGGSLRLRVTTATLVTLGIRENVWFHIAATYDGSATSSGLNVFINGKNCTQSKSSNGSYTAMENTSQAVSVLGADSNVEVLNGYLDEVAILNRKLDPIEVAQIAGFRRGISMPSGLEANSPFLTNDLMTDIFVTGTIRAGVSDQFISFTPGETLEPFKDHDRFEQSNTSSYAKTGSSIDNVGNTKFTSPLKSKTQLKFDYNMSSSYTFQSLTASIAYLAFNETGEGQPFFRIVNVAANEATTPSNTSATRNFGNEAKLFGPFGTKTMSGSVVNNSPSRFHGQTVESGYNDAILDINRSSHTTNTAYDAKDSAFLLGLGASAISVSLTSTISSPFLLEKAIIKLPLSAASNWLADTTLAVIPSSANQNRDVGGPCLTFSILNYRAEDRSTEIILSATIIPSTDNISSTLTPSGSRTVPWGFLAYSGTPAAVLSANTGSSFIGSAVLHAEPGVSHGMYTIALASTSSFLHSQIGNISPIGRSMEIKSSGRSYFRNDFLDLDKEDFVNLSAGLNTSQIFKLMKFSASPYLLLPSDSLIFAISKYRPAMTDPDGNRETLTGSHTLSIPSGSNFSVTLYGSLIKEDSEFEDSLNQHLTSLSVNQNINYEPLLDSFDVEPRLHFVSGSLDQFITGSMVTIQDGVISTGARVRIGSSILKQDMSGPPNTSTRQIFREACSFQRFTQHVSNERFYDSLLPRPDKMFFIHGKTPVFTPAGGFYNLATNVFIITQHTTASLAGQGNSEWIRSFPFESKFSSVERTVDPFRETASIRDVTDVLLPNPLTIDGAGIYFENTTTEPGQATPATPYRLGSEASRRPNNELVAKVLFGIGSGPSGSVYPEARISSNYVANVIARGTKYGLVNWKPQFTKAVYTRNKFRGMKADMLEQRLFTKTRDDQTSKISSINPVFCEFSLTNPEATFSSNLSSECTSSLPYFDGVYRNRSSLLSGSA